MTRSAGIINKYQLLLECTKDIKGDPQIEYLKHKYFEMMKQAVIILELLEGVNWQILIN
jgi:hypothetical protein